MRARRRVNRWATCVAVAFLWGAPTARAADIGYRGPSFSASSVIKPSGQKPQSKLWYHDGTWWGSLFAPGPEEYRVHRLDPVTQTWIDTGTPLDDRNSSEGDVLWDGTHLYVASSSDAAGSPDATRIRILRLTYDPVARGWNRDPGYDAAIPGGPVEAVVLDKDTTGRLWLTFTRANSVYVAHTSGPPADAWEPPYVLPGTDTADLDADDISAVVAYGGRIGVMWSNQTAQAMYLASHADGAPDSAWTQTTALAGPFAADDHINLKSVQGAGGRMFAAVKTSKSDHDPTPSLDQVDLLELNGTAWSTHVFGTAADDHTRPIVLTDQLTRQLYLFATSPTVETAGAQTIYYKQTSLDRPDFAPGLGTAFLRSDAGLDINDATSTKQDLSVSRQLVVLASDPANYWHNTLQLTHPDPPPTPTATPVPSGPVIAVDRTAPRLSGLKARPRRFRRRAHTTVSFTLSEAATVRVTAERAASGRRVGGRCVRPTRSNRKKRSCTRYVVLRRTVTRRAAAGAVRIAFSGRRLAPGRHRLAVVATDAAGNASPARRLAVRVLR